MNHIWLKTLLLIICCCAVENRAVSRALAEGVPEIPRIDSVAMAAAQPHEFDAAIIWYDDFDEAYWNSGSPVDQSRWIDNFVVSIKPIGPVVSPRNPVLIKTPYRGPGSQQSWEVEIAGDPAGTFLVWKSAPHRGADRLGVGTQPGRFVGPLAGENQLEASKVYFVRARQQSDTGHWSAWSAWHQPFQTH